MQDNIERNKLIVEHRNLADRIAKKKKKSCIPNIQLSELKSAAYVGLIDAATKFDDKKGQFKIYARYRIYGEINDYLRKYYGYRRKKALRSWSLDVPIYLDNCMKTSPLEEMLSYEDDASFKIDNEESFNKISDCLTKEQKKILYLYYFCGLTMKVIGGKMDFTESRISQILSESIEIIRNNFEGDETEIFNIRKKKSVNFLSTAREPRE